MHTNFKPYRKDAPHSYALGVLPTLELLRQRPGAVRQVLLNTAGMRCQGVARIRELCDKLRIDAVPDDRALRRLSQAENCYAAGVFAKYSDQLSPQRSHVVLVNPDDLGNLGAIMRTMLGYGVRDLAIIPPAADMFHPKSVRASMGAIFHLQCACFTDFAAYRGSYSQQSYAFMTDGESALAATTFTEPCTLIFGNEGRGLPAHYARLAHGVRIEQCSNIDSLNLAVAAGIALHQVYIQHAKASSYEPSTSRTATSCQCRDPG